MNTTLLDKKWIEYLTNQPETGMGFQYVSITLNNGLKSQHTVLNCEHLVDEDFPVDQIKDIEVEQEWERM